MGLLVLGALFGLSGGERSDPVLVGPAELVDRGERLLPTLHARSGLQLPDTVRLTWVDREALEAHVDRRLSSERPERIAYGESRALRLLGLLPAGADLRALLREAQVTEAAGYYDPEAKLVALVRGEPPEVQATTFAHEIVHALQDATVPLTPLLSPEVEGDRREATRAVLEAHATLLAIEWMAGFVHPADEESIEHLAEVEAVLTEAVRALAAETPAVARAPSHVRDLLLFPYREGAMYLLQLWRWEGRPAPPVGERLPRTTRDVLHPEPFLAGSALGVWIPELQSDRDGAEASGVLGALGVRSLLRGTESELVSELTAAWVGDRWVLGEGGDELVWAVLWRGEEEEARFRGALEAKPSPEGVEWSWSGPRSVGEDGWTATILCAGPDAEEPCTGGELFRWEERP